jgi:hypothetical protein
MGGSGHVKRVKNDGNGWRATQHSFICSKHFEKDDYIQLPTADTVSYEHVRPKAYEHVRPKAYEHVRSIIPLPNPSLIRKWSS